MLPYGYKHKGRRNMENLLKMFSPLEFLEYRSYVYNRKKYPEMSLMGYKHLFSNWEKYEEEFQKEERKNE